MVNRVEGEFQAVGDSPLVENIVEMVFYRLCTDEELLADFTVAEALCYELYDLFLAVAEQRLLAALPGFRRLLKRVDHFGGHAIVEPDFSVENLAYALHQQ